MSWSVSAWFRAAAARFTGASKATKRTDSTTVKWSPSQVLLLRLSEETSSMTPAEAQDIVMDFSDRLARVALPKVVVSSAVLPSSQKNLHFTYSRRLLPYSKEQAVCAFKTYYVFVPDAAAASLALLMLHQWVVLLLADELEEPLTFDDAGRDYALREDLLARLVTERATLDSIRNLNHLPPSANAHLPKRQ